MKFFMHYWALTLLSMLSILLVMLILDTSWPVSYVYVLSTPSGASVSDGNGFFWSTPAQIPVQHDGLLITVTHPGRVPVDTVLVPEMSSEPVLISLPYSFPVDVSSEPSSASFFLDDTFIGQTPLNLNIDEPGIHLFTLMIDNMIIYRDTVSLLANCPDSIHYELPRISSNGMIYVPPERGVRSDLHQPYLIARYEVTNREFCNYLRSLEPSPARDTTNRWGRTDILEGMFPGDFPLPFYIRNGEWAIQDGMDEFPAAGMTFGAAEAYCEWLTSMDTAGLIFRLPCENEWSRAALAGSCGPWPWGARRPDGNLLNLSDNSESMLRRHPSIDDGFSQSAPVGSYPYNNWGLCDVAGNVWEYCRAEELDSVAAAMGGSWISSMDDCRCDARMYPDTSLGYPYIGFRVAASIASPE
jgi:hypothetical protein